MFGEGPMPRKSWAKWLKWATSPYRVMLLFTHTSLLLFILTLGMLSWPLALVEGLACLWLLERMRE